MQIRRIQVHNYSVFYFFFFISNMKDVGSNLENNKSIKFCLHKFEIFPPLFPIKGLCHQGKKYYTQKRRLGFCGSVIDITLWLNPSIYYLLWPYWPKLAPRVSIELNFKRKMDISGVWWVSKTVPFSYWQTYKLFSNFMSIHFIFVRFCSAGKNFCHCSVIV